MDDYIKKIVANFIDNKTILIDKKAVIGFDGFIDEITRVVKYRDSIGNVGFFDTITEFSEFIRTAGGKSADMEIVVNRIKYGGNAPIMSVALHCLGVDSLCIVSMGYPHLNDVFKNLPYKPKIISVCEPGYCHAFEFRDGKLMFADLSPLEHLTWNRISEVIDKKTLIKILSEASLLAFVNWSQLRHIETIWNALQSDILPYIEKTNSIREIFFDLADPSKRSDMEITRALGIICSFSKFGRVTLGLNEYEAIRIYNALKNKLTGSDDFHSIYCETSLEKIGLNIFNNINVEFVLIHAIDYCVCISAKGLIKKTGRYINNPKLTTGGGDNFNAGFCAARLVGMDIDEAMVIAMAVSSAYVESGNSPFIESLESLYI